MSRALETKKGKEKGKKHTQKEKERENSFRIAVRLLIFS